MNGGIILKKKIIVLILVLVILGSTAFSEAKKDYNKVSKILKEKNFEETINVIVR